MANHGNRLTSASYRSNNASYDACYSSSNANRDGAYFNYCRFLHPTLLLTIFISRAKNHECPLKARQSMSEFSWVTMLWRGRGWLLALRNAFCIFVCSAFQGCPSCSGGTRRAASSMAAHFAAAWAKTIGSAGMGGSWVSEKWS